MRRASQSSTPLANPKNGQIVDLGMTLISNRSAISSTHTVGCEIDLIPRSSIVSKSEGLNDHLNKSTSFEIAVPAIVASNARARGQESGGVALRAQVVRTLMAKVPSAGLATTHIAWDNPCTTGEFSLGQSSNNSSTRPARVR